MQGRSKGNARLSSRISVYFPARFDCGSTHGECMVLQISEGGMMLSTRAELEVRSKGTFRLRAFADEPEIDLSGEVIHRLYDREQDGPEPLIKYGIRFLSPRNSDRAKISRVLRSAYTLRVNFDDTPEGA